MSTSTLAPTDSTTVEPADDFPALTVNDRCDHGGCAANDFNPFGVRAFFRLVLENGQDLLFCKHHGDQQVEIAAEKGIRVIDETGVLNAKITSGHV